MRRGSLTVAHPSPRARPACRQLREESKGLEGEVEESRIRAREAEERAAAAEAAALAQRDAARRAADTIQRLKRQLGGGEPPAAAAADVKAEDGERPQDGAAQPPARIAAR